MGDLSCTNAVRRSWDRIAVELRVGRPTAPTVSRQAGGLGYLDQDQGRIVMGHLCAGPARGDSDESPADARRRVFGRCRAVWEYVSPSSVRVRRIYGPLGDRNILERLGYGRPTIPEPCLGEAAPVEVRSHLRCVGSLGPVASPRHCSWSAHFGCAVSPLSRARCRNWAGLCRISNPRGESTRFVDLSVRFRARCIPREGFDTGGRGYLQPD